MGGVRREGQVQMGPGGRKEQCPRQRGGPARAGGTPPGGAGQYGGAQQAHGGVRQVRRAGATAGG
eukprot:5535489-Prymnesium_polylepis.1